MITLTKNSQAISYKAWKFPGQELGVKIEGIDPDAAYCIRAHSPDSDDIVLAMNIADCLARAGVEKHRVFLSMPYLPYARQDRACSEGESFALEVFVKALSTGYFGGISVSDVHSAVGLQLLDQYFDEVLHIEQWMCAVSLPKFDCLVAPDKGASEKIIRHIQVIEHDVPVAILSKTRKDGQVIYDPLEVGTLMGDVCVVDDLCDGGATFVSLGKMLLATQPEITSLSLYVTHGLFSKGVGVLEGIYDKIYVHNLMNENATGVIEI